MSPQRHPSPVTNADRKVIDTLESSESTSKPGPVPREKLPIRVAPSPNRSPSPSPMKQEDSEVEDLVLGMVRRIAVGHWQVRTPDGTILDSSFPSAESAHLALGALDEQRQKEKKRRMKKKPKNKGDMFRGLKKMPDSYYKENRNDHRRAAKRSNS
eukprot:UN27307